MPQQLLVFVSRPYTTKASVPWELSQCQVQEVPLSPSRPSGSSSAGTLNALQHYGPLTFDIILRIIAQKNAHLSQTSNATAQWTLFEVVHGCIQSGNTFSFVLSLEGQGTSGGDSKSALPGY